MRVEVLADASEFWQRFRKDLAIATGSAYVQTFSFEGDRVGTALGRVLERCPARDRRLLVDRYSLLYQSDRLVLGRAWLEKSFRREFFLALRWMKRLRAGGVRTRFGNPLGPRPFDVIRRNHKKLIVVDERIAYFGGINFCDHNFDWHDMMLRVDHPAVGRLLADDFRATWAGQARSMDHTIGGLRLTSTNGRGNAAGMTPLTEAIRGATRSVDVVSPYLSPPFTDWLGEASRAGARVRVLTPSWNNKPAFKSHVAHAARRHGFELFEYPDGMNHIKAMLIDGETLVTGSSNFDFLSFTLLDELVVMTRDRGTTDHFVERVWDPDMAAAEPVRPQLTLRTAFGHAVVRASSALSRFVASPKRPGQPMR